MKEFNLPEGWSFVSLYDLVDVIGGVSYAPEDITSLGIRIIRGGNIQGNLVELRDDDVFLPHTYKNSENTLHKGDVILVASTGSIEALGRTATVWDDMENVQIGAFLRILRPKHPKYAALISAWLSSEHYFRYIRLVAKGTSINNISLSHIKGFRIPIPTDDILQSFDALYNAVAKKNNINRAINQNLEALAKQLYDYWFVQFDFPNEEGKPYKSSGGAMVWNEKLKRNIPEGWEVTNIGGILDKVISTPRLSTDEYLSNGTYPVIDQTTNVYYAGFTNNKDAVVNQFPAVVFGDHSCAVKYVNFPFVRGADGTQVMLSKCANISIEYLYFVVKGIKIGKGYARHYSFLKEQLIIMPPKREAKMFECMAQILFEQITRNRKEILSLIKQRDELLPLLMNGQITIE